MTEVHAITKSDGDTTAVDTVGHAGAGGDPVPAPRRSWAPDLARGAVLLGIALANVGLYLHGTEMGPGLRPVDGSALDRALDFVVTLLVNDRSRPMFALLFGFGLVTMARRLGGSGTEPRRRRSSLLRRQLLLIAFGGVHAALLFEGDILGMYGATGLVRLLLMNRRPRVLLAWGTVSLVLLGVLLALVALAPDASAASSVYLASVVERLSVWVLGVVGGTALMIVLAPMLVGVVMARAGLLDRPWEHVALLRGLAVLGALVASPAACRTRSWWPTYGSRGP